jgi:glycosyltransferase involved in cell wall biosynthesis
MDKPLLSICIATYNRADYIGETLKSIVRQLENDVELLVVDGASTDATQDVVNDFSRKDSRVRYIRLPEKGGVDHDYDRAVELAEGEFCWLFTDDDLLELGAVAAVKAAISKGYDLVVVNAEERDKTLTEVLEGRRLFIHHDAVYAPSDTDRFFKDAAKHISFIGAVVIRRSVWLERDRKSYFGTEFVHIGVIFQRRMTAPILAIAHPYIIIRLGNSQWTPRGFDIWMLKWPRLIWSFKDISLEAKQKIVEKEPWKGTKNLLIQRRLGGYTTKSYKIYLSKLDMGFLWKLKALAIAFLPIWTIAPVFDALLRRRRRKRADYIAVLGNK